MSHTPQEGRASRKRTVLFLQLPQLDNDVVGPHENLPLAAIYLQYAAERVGEQRFYRFMTVPDGLQDGDNARLVAGILAARPDVLACTVYLWNIERTLRILRALRAAGCRARIALGGPEVARQHPFLFRRRLADTVVVGEGENVFPALLRAFRGGPTPDFTTVAWLTRNGYCWGRRIPPPVDLNTALPPPDHPAWRLTGRRMAYLETTRGCPLRCAYCRYPHLRRQMSVLDPDEVAARVAAWRRRGAREIRFIDPTFNAHPRFQEVLRSVARANRAHALELFAELNAERLTAVQADLLAAAHFTEVEVGLQSRDSRVLTAIRRPTNLRRFAAGLRMLTRRRIKVTLDVMYGLPLQKAADAWRTALWAARQRGVHVQCLQTLLLPGTELRATASRWGLRAERRPPYGVTATPWISATEMRELETRFTEDPRFGLDPRTARFVGHHLSDLFPERVWMPWRTEAPLPGRSSRRALLLAGRDLFGSRQTLRAIVRRALQAEPDILWQFVLVPTMEEPLDLLDELVNEIHRFPPHVLDRYAAVALQGRIASRRLFVWLTHGRRFDRSWVRAAESLLEGAFY